MLDKCKVEENPAPYYFPTEVKVIQIVQKSTLVYLNRSVKEQVPEPTIAQAAPPDPQHQVSLEQESTKGGKLWTLTENRAYLNFLRDHIQQYENPEGSKKHCRNLRMSRYIKTRTSIQCRSHHQKMLRYHQNQRGIIRYLERLFELEEKGELQKKGKPMLRLRRKKAEMRKDGKNEVHDEAKLMSSGEDRSLNEQVVKEEEHERGLNIVKEEDNECAYMVFTEDRAKKEQY